MNAATAYEWYDNKERCYRVLLPIWMYGEPVGWTARRLDDDDNMRYRDATGMDKLDILYPWHIVEQMETESVALVEGPYDALRLVDLDIPALSTLGSGCWDSKKVVHLINLGIRHVIIAGDGDQAGDKFRETIEKDLQHMFVIDHYYCAPKHDPGKLPSMREYDKLYKLVNKKKLR